MWDLDNWYTGDYNIYQSDSKDNKKEQNVNCWCGTKAVKKCKRCDQPLCNNYFCKIEHNSQKH